MPFDPVNKPRAEATVQTLSVSSPQGLQLRKKQRLLFAQPRLART